MRGVVAGAPSALNADDGWFAQFVAVDAPRLRQVLVARYGHEVGGEAFAEAIAWAWEQRDRLENMANPVGYLYRVGQSATRRHHRWTRNVSLIDADRPVAAEPPDEDLLRALATLKHAQRVAVVLVHSHGWSYGEVAEVLDVSTDAVRNHVHRGLRRLRALLEEDS
jgi:RNA polymerase sigma factor (sigma-70 family)